MTYLLRLSKINLELRLFMSVLTDYRKEKDEFFASDPQSPLTPKQQKDFKGLHYYPENPDLRFTLSIQEFPEKEIVPIQTSKKMSVHTNVLARSLFQWRE